MPKLVFRVESDVQKVINLRKEINKLESALKKMDASKSPQAAMKLTNRLADCKSQMKGLVTEAANAGSKIDSEFRKKIFNSSKVVNELSGKIITQSSVVRNLRNRIGELALTYKQLDKSSSQRSSLEKQLNNTKMAVIRETTALQTLRNKQAQARLSTKELRDEYASLGMTMKGTTVIENGTTMSLGRLVTMLGGAYAVKNFGQQVISVTSEMQKLQISFTTMLKSGDKAQELMNFIVDFAEKTPFELMGVAQGAKQMLAYGFTVDQIKTQLKTLGDVAAGVQAPIGDLIYLYGTLKAQGRAMTIDIRQFANRGIPIYEELAKVLGTTKDKVADFVKAGKVGFDQVQEAFANMTKKGGIYADLMVNTSKSWGGQLSNVSDNLQQELNAFGKKYADQIQGGITLTADLVEHLDAIISVLGSLIATYGTYKAVLLLVAAAQKAVGFAKSIELIVSMRHELGLATAAQQAFNAASKTNVYALMISLLVGLGTAIYMFTRNTDGAKKVQEEFNKSVKEGKAAMEAHKNEINKLITTIQDKTAADSAQMTAMDELKAKYPSIIKKYIDEEGHLKNIIGLKKAIANFDSTVNTEVSRQNAENTKKEMLAVNKELKYRKSAQNGQRSDFNQLSYSELEEKLISLVKKYNLQKSLYDTQKKAQDKAAKQTPEKKVSNYGDDYKSAEAAWKKDKAKLAEIEKNREKFTTEQYKKAAENEKAAKDAFSNLGGVVKEKKLTKKKKEVKVSVSQTDGDLKRINDSADNEAKSIVDDLATIEDNLVSLQKKYRSVAQQREDLAKGYDKDINTLTDSGDSEGADNAKGAKTKALQDFDFKEFQKSSNFSAIFDNLGKLPTDSLKDFKEQLQEFVKTNNSLSPENMKTLMDAINNISTEIDSRNPFTEMGASFKELKTATIAETAAQEAYDKALKEGNENEIKGAKDTLTKAKKSKAEAQTSATTALQSGVGKAKQVSDSANSIMNIMEELGVKSPKWLSGYMEGVGTTLDGLSEMDITKPMTIITGGLKATEGTVKEVVSLGGTIKAFKGADYSEYDAMVAKYSKLMNVWDELLDKKKAYINQSYGAEATKAGQEALDLLNTEKEANEILAKKRLSSGASTGSHSIWYRMWKGSYDYEGTNWRDVAGNITSGLSKAGLGNAKFNGMSDMLNMTGDQLSWIKEKYTGLWTNMDGDFEGYLENIIKYGETEQDILDQINEQLTGISFDSFEDSYVSLLEDLDSSNEDFADNFKKYLQKAVLSSLIKDKYSERIKKLYIDWSKDMKGGLTAEEQAQLTKEQNDLTKEIMAARKELIDSLGWDDSEEQSASSGSVASMSEDTGNELNGRFTAVQMSVTQIVSQISEEITVCTGIRDIADDTRTIIANSYLELKQISENTGEIIKPIKEMRDDLAEVKKNTAKL